MAGGARGIQSIEVSGRILQALVDACAPLMLKDLAQAADLAPAQCHAYLTSLRHVGLVYQEPDSGHYRMGPFAMRLGIGWLRGSALPAAAIAQSKALSEETGIMTLVAIWSALGPTIVHINEGRSPTALNLRQGSLYSITGTATGRVFAAYYKDAAVAARIDSDFDTAEPARSPGPRITRQEFETEVTATRARGYALARETPIPGINAISVPVMDDNGAFGLAVTMLGPPSEVDLSDASDTIQRLLDTASAITRAVSQHEETAARRA